MSTHAKDTRWALAISLIFLLFISLPLITGYASQTPNERFIGTFFDRMDYSNDLASMQYGAAGHWNNEFHFTSENGTSIWIRNFYVLLGHISHWTGLNVFLTYHLARLLFSLGACLAIYRLLGRVFSSINTRRIAFILALVGSGVGWVQLLFNLLPGKISPIDLWLLDGYPYFSFALFPHYAAMIAAMAVALTAFLDHIEQPRWYTVPLVAACALFVQVNNPLFFALVDAAMAGEFIFVCWRERRIRLNLAVTLGVIAILQIPLLVYTYLLFARNPLLAIFNRQAEILSPTPIYYLLGFALLWLFAVVGTWQVIKKKEPKLGWAVGWILFALVMVYMPLQQQSRFIAAITLPLGALAAVGLSIFADKVRERVRINAGAITAGFTALASISSFMVIGFYSLNMRNHPPELFEPAALVRAVEWLGKNASPGELVLADEPASQLVGMRTALRLYSGHEFETLNYAEKTAAVALFYDEPSVRWLMEQGIDWVIYGPKESGANPTFPDGSAETAYQADQVTIYRILHP